MRFSLPGDPEPSLSDRLLGVLLSLVVICVILGSWLHLPLAHWLAGAGTIGSIALLTPRVRPSRQIFVALSAALAVYAVATAPDWTAVLGKAMIQASFILAFFCALATLRHAAELSDAITRAAIYLASQPPGRRYSALTIGGQVFALVLNYGSISLLGTMARNSAEREPDPEIRKIRKKRMITAVHRGFAASLFWSPLAFSVVISTTVIPGATWGSIVLPALGSAALMTAIGWKMDSIFKTKLRPGQTPAAPEGEPDTVRALLPVLYLLLLIGVPVLVIHFLLDLPASRIVLLVVPVVAGLWLVRMAPVGTAGLHLTGHVGQFVFSELPSFRSEMVLLSCAGFIGSAAGALLAPLVAQTGLDLTAMPLWLLLILPIFLIPLGGQIGMNPILFVSLFGPLLPSPEALGISPVPMVLALTGGWALSGLTSPFTASVMLSARLGDTTPADVSLRWNGPFTLICAVVLSAWVLLLAAL